MAEKRVSRFKTLMAVIGNPSETELEDTLLEGQGTPPALSTSETGSPEVTAMQSVINPAPSKTEHKAPELQEPSLELPPEIVWIAHTKIHRDADQSRRYFDPDELKKMARSMQAVGIIDPLSVRPSPNYPGEYELLAGEKRHRSAEIAKLAEVPCRVFEVADDIAEDIKAISNLQRGDLNKWEETSAIMGMLCRNLQKSPEEVVSILNRASNQRRGLTDNVVRSEEWAVVEDVFNLVGRLTPESFRKHRVPLLKLPRSIQDVLQQGKLSYTKVNEVLKVKDPEQQRHLLHEAIAANLSVDSIQARVKELRQTQSQTQKAKITESDRLSARLSSASKAIKRAKFWQDPKKSDRFKELLAEMESLIG